MLLRFFSKLGLQDLAIIIALIPMLCLQLQDFAQDPGVGWHLSTGEYINNTGSIPRIDPFLYSLTPRPWICDQWLSDLIIFKVFNFGSWPLVYGFFSVVYLITYFGFLYPCVAVCTNNRIASSLVCYLAMRAGLIHFILRPVVFGQLLFCTLFVCISFFRERKLSLRTFSILLPVLFMLWANLHPSFFMGFILCSCLVLEGLYKRVWLSLTNDQLALTVVQGSFLLLVCFLATLVNPFGINLHLSIIELTQSTFFINYHSEWISLNFKPLQGRIVQIFLAIICIAPFFHSNSSNRQSKERHLDSFSSASLLVFAHLGFEMVRALPHFLTIASIPVVCSIVTITNGISDSKLRILQPLFRFTTWIEQRERKTWYGFPVVVLFSAYILVSALVTKQIPFYSDTFGPRSESRAVEVIKRLKLEAERTGKRIVALASPDLGGEITFYGEGKVLAVIDDRNTLLGEQFYQSYSDKVRIEGKGKAMFEDYAKSLGANRIILRKDDPIAIWLTKDGMTGLVTDDKFVVFEL